MNGKLDYLYSCRNFSAWVKADNKPLNIVDKENMISKLLFEKPFDALYTYEKEYIRQQLAKAVAY